MLEQEPRKDELIINVASTRLLKRLLPLDYLVRTDQYEVVDGKENFDLKPERRIARTSPENPAVLLEHDASVCTLFLGFTPEGVAALFHEPILFLEELNSDDEDHKESYNHHNEVVLQSLKNLMQELLSVLKTSSGEVKFIVSGQGNMNSTYQRGEVKKAISELTPQDSVTEMFLVKRKSRISSIYQIFRKGRVASKVTGMIFVPKYVAKDHRNHLLLLDSEDVSEDAKVISLLLPKVESKLGD